MTAAPSRVEIPIALRGLESPDLPLVFSSWLSSFRHSPTMRAVPNGVYYEGQHRRIERLIAESSVMCAVNPSDPAQLYGWACTGEGVIHYVCCKDAFKRMGVARRLLAPLMGQALRFTHRTGLVAELNLPSQWIYDPFVLEAR